MLRRCLEGICARLRVIGNNAVNTGVASPHLVDTYATLRAWCLRTGHGLGQKEHEADRWVATTAVWLQVPLVSHDGIFANGKVFELLTVLS